VDGINHRIFIPPGQTNIGYIARVKHYVVSSTWNASSPNYGDLFEPDRFPSGAYFGAQFNIIPAQYDVGIEVQVRLVKTSASFPTNGANVDFAALLSDIIIGFQAVAGPGPPPFQFPQFTARVNATFSMYTPTCTTPSLNNNSNTVPLGVAPLNTFSGPGTVTAWKAFTLRVNCTQGFNQGVQYRFLACPTCTSPPPGSILSLDSNATASGVGVQVRHANNTPLAFNSDYTLTDYDNTTGGQYDIPLRARIVQTCPTNNCVTPGSVRASMIMQMIYP